MKLLSLHIAPDHPAGAGHFPGNPIIPGALLLAEVLRTIGLEEKARYSACNVKSAKFQHPVRPGDTVEIEYSYSPLHHFDFKCTAKGILVLSGGIAATIDAGVSDEQ